MTEVLLPKFRDLGGAARGLERLVLVAVTVAARSGPWGSSTTCRWPSSTSSISACSSGGSGRGVPRRAGRSGRPARPRALVRLVAAAAGLGVGCTSPSLSVDRVLARHPLLGAARAGRGRPRAGPRGGAPGRGLDPHGDRPRLHRVRKVRLALPRDPLRKGSRWSRIAVYLYLDSGGTFGLPLGVTASIVSRTSASARPSTPCAATPSSPGRDGGDGPVSRRVGEDGRRLLEPLWHRVGQRGGQRRRRRRGHHPDDEALGVSAAPRRRHRGGVVERRSDHAPVMGSAAFLIAEYLSIPYGQVALAAPVPAVLYYLALFVQVDLESAKLGSPVSLGQIPALGEVCAGMGVRRPPRRPPLHADGGGWEAGKAGMLAVGVTFSWAASSGDAAELASGAGHGAGHGADDAGPHRNHHAGRHRHRRVPALGLTSKLPMVLTSPRAATSPAPRPLRDGLHPPRPVAAHHGGVHHPRGARRAGPGPARHRPLAAHLFLFYFGMLSLITPPDCLATYAAAAIAKADSGRRAGRGCGSESWPTSFRSSSCSIRR